MTTSASARTSPAPGASSRFLPRPECGLLSDDGRQSPRRAPILTTTGLLNALHRGDGERVSELLAREPELNVFEVAALGKVERLREILEGDPESANAYGDD